MKFESIAITGGQGDSPDPRTTPADVPAALIKETPPTLTNTDTPPTLAVLTLEGTATQNADVTLYAVDDTVQLDAASHADDPRATDAGRRFYSLGSAVEVTVGALSFVRIVPGRVYYRITGAPAADARLKIGFAVGALDVVVEAP